MKQRIDMLRDMAVLSKDVASLLKGLKLRGIEALPGRIPPGPDQAKEEAPVGEVETVVVAPPRDLGQEARLEFIRRQALVCQRCRLSTTRTKVVFGIGNPGAGVMFIGEGPGANEDTSGEPFVGRAGKLLNKMLGAIGLRRQDVFITNIVKCRPPGNRDPQPDEVAACRPFLDAQLETISPKIVVTLGRPSAQTLLNDRRPLSRLRSVVHQFAKSKLVVTYHPAFLLRNPARKKAGWEDLVLLSNLMVQEGLKKKPEEYWWRA